MVLKFEYAGPLVEINSLDLSAMNMGSSIRFLPYHYELYRRFYPIWIPGGYVVYSYLRDEIRVRGGLQNT